MLYTACWASLGKYYLSWSVQPPEGGTFIKYIGKFDIIDQNGHYNDFYLTDMTELKYETI